MSRDSIRGLRCPHCQTHLALVPVPSPADAESASARLPEIPATPHAAGHAEAFPVNPSPSMILREEWTPPPVREVLAVYAGRSTDTATALRGAARVRESLNRARLAATQRRNAQKAAKRTTPSTPRSA
ncbi:MULTISPECIES: hypothetical protein [Actinomadura]|uniref:Uncharacterized protein n=2 Tax=Actinomadura yumaensis TaxID=111807 RepID=A0ABW2CHG5_9ACTN|nr:hypothetical protein [Actinomadura sp. J1-007]